MANELKTRAVHVVMGPRGIAIDKDGRLSFSDPEILQAVLTGGVGTAEGLAAEGNTLCNAYQCTGLTSPQDLLAARAGVARPK